MEKLLEGAQLDQRLWTQVSNDPNMTFGFEAEFLILGLGPILQKIMKTNAVRRGEYVTKVLGKAKWPDLIRYFEPLQAGTDPAGNDEVMKNRLMQLYTKVTGEEPIGKPSDLFILLQQRYKVYHLITLLRLFPRNGFDVDKAQNTQIRQVLRSGNVRMATIRLKTLEETPFRMFLAGEEAIQFNASDTGENREIIYEILAKRLENYLGEPVRYSVDETHAQTVSRGYTNWVITYDSRFIAGKEGDKFIGDDGFSRIGVELISPVKPFGQGYERMLKIFELLNNFELLGIKGLRVETTHMTGFHVNLGVKGKKVDYLKLLFLMGEQYIAKKFDRENLTDMAELVLRKMARKFLSGTSLPRLIPMFFKQIPLTDQDIKTVLELLRREVPVYKFMRVNLRKLQQGWIEFRRIGNKDYHKRGPEISRIVRQLAGIMHVATDPEAYRNEYLKKVYRFVRNLLGHFQEPNIGRAV